MSHDTGGYLPESGHRGMRFTVKTYELGLFSSLCVLMVEWWIGTTPIYGGSAFMMWL